jgi:hypothetical protein
VVLPSLNGKRSLRAHSSAPQYSPYPPLCRLLCRPFLVLLCGTPIHLVKPSGILKQFVCRSALLSPHWPFDSHAHRPLDFSSRPAMFSHSGSIHGSLRSTSGSFNILSSPHDTASSLDHDSPHWTVEERPEHMLNSLASPSPPSLPRCVGPPLVLSLVPSTPTNTDFFRKSAKLVDSWNTGLPKAGLIDTVIG